MILFSRCLHLLPFFIFSFIFIIDYTLPPFLSARPIVRVQEIHVSILFSPFFPYIVFFFPFFLPQHQLYIDDWKKRDRDEKGGARGARRETKDVIS